MIYPPVITPPKPARHNTKPCEWIKIALSDSFLLCNPNTELDIDIPSVGGERGSKGWK